MLICFDLFFKAPVDLVNFKEKFQTIKEGNDQFKILCKQTSDWETGKEIDMLIFLLHTSLIWTEK